jgi:hypothetical protein
LPWDGKERVGGSSPPEGSAKFLQIGTFLISSICIRIVRDDAEDVVVVRDTQRLSRRRARDRSSSIRRRHDVDVKTPMQASTWCSLVGVPPAEKFRRQIEAG